MAVAHLLETPRDPWEGKALGEGKYELFEKLTSGSEGSVYRARAKGRAKLLRVKLLHGSHKEDELVGGFAREAEAARRIAHKSVLRVLDFGREPAGPLFLVTEDVQGVTLKNMLQATGVLPLDRALRIMQEICSAVQAAHEAKVIHRALRPENILLWHEGTEERVKVQGFGVAKIENAAGFPSAVPDHTIEVVSGTPEYMAPEQCRGESLDERSDTYSLGCILYEMVCGRPPFVGDSPVGVLFKHVSEPPSPPSSVEPRCPSVLDEVLLKALAKAPGERFQTACEFARALEGVPVVPVLSSRRDDPTGPMRRPRRSARPAPAIPIRSTPPGSWRVSAQKRRRAVSVFVGAALLGVFAVWFVARPAFLLKVGPLGTAEAATESSGHDAGRLVAEISPARWDTVGATVAPRAVLDSAAARGSVDNESVVVKVDPAVEVDGAAASPEPVPVISHKAGRRTSRARRRKGDVRGRAADSGRVLDVGAEVAAKPQPPSLSNSVDADGRVRRVRAGDALWSEEVSPTVRTDKRAGPLDARVAISGVEVHGSLPVALVRKALDRTLAGLRGCYQGAARRVGWNDFGHVTVRLQLDEMGRTRAASVGGSVLPGLDPCLARRARALRIEGAHGSTPSDVSFVLAFEPISR